MPILGFNVYNPDKKIITDFTNTEFVNFDNDLITETCLRKPLFFSHAWANQSTIRTLLLDNTTIDKIL